MVCVCSPTAIVALKPPPQVHLVLDLKMQVNPRGKGLISMMRTPFTTSSTTKKMFKGIEIANWSPGKLPRALKCCLRPEKDKISEEHKDEGMAMPMSREFH